MPQVIDIRASSIAALVDCPLRGASLALGLVDPLPSTAPACIGSACHEGTAKYDAARINGEKMSVDDAAGFVVDYLKDPGQEVNWGGVSMREAERRALGVHTRYCTDIAPHMAYEAVELPLESLSIEFPENDIQINLTGTLDRIYRGWIEFEPVVDNTVTAETTAPIRRGILDIKTGARACSQAPGRHKAQLATYELLAELTTGESVTAPALIGALQTSSEYRVEVKEVLSPRTALLGTDDQIGILNHLARMFQTGDFIGNPSSWLCSDKYCPLWNGCIFR